ncbi:MAG: response regulator [Burkholderiaceae bacterium]
MFTWPATNSGRCQAGVRSRPQFFDILLTDIAMPGKLQGPALARLLRKTDPTLSVVFISGYATEAMAGENVPHPEDIRLTKPISREKLAGSRCEIVGLLKHLARVAGSID